MIKRFSLFGLLILMGCSTNNSITTLFPVEIANAFFVNHENQTTFTIEFQQKLPSHIKLEKLYFKNQEAVLIQNSPQSVSATFEKPDLILDSNPKNEYGNQPAIHFEPFYKLKDTEALMEYFKNGKIKRFKITNVMEKSNK
jgi:hypothetical protein